MDIAIVGTAGRDRSKVITRVLYFRMYDRLLHELDQLAPVQDRRLRTGGAAVSDHLAVTAFHQKQCARTCYYTSRQS